MDLKIVDPPYPNLELLFVNGGQSVVCAVLLKFCPKFYRISFMAYIPAQLFTSAKKKKLKMIKVLQNKMGGSEEV